MNAWDKLFAEKLKEVIHHKHEKSVYATLSPTANGNCAREQIAEEYYKQADRIKELEHCLIVEQEHNEMLEKESDEPVAWMQTFTQEYKGVREEKHAVNIEQIGINDIPLYTRPSKQLSYDDIDRCAWKTGMWCDGTPDEWDLHAIRNFARAIIEEMNK